MKTPPRSLRRSAQAAFSWRTCRVGRLYYAMVRSGLLPLLGRAGLTPNQMTMTGTVIAVLVPLGFFLHPIAGLLCLAASAVADSLDGLIARDLHQSSPFGAFLDSSLDRLSDVFYLMGFWILFRPRPGFSGATILIFTAMLLTQMISYVKARAESLGAGCPVGLMDRTARVIFLMAWAILVCIRPRSADAVLWGGLCLYCGLTLATVVQRILHVRRQMTSAS